VEIKEVGETPHATNVINPCIKKIAREDLPIVNAMNLTNTLGVKNGPNETNCLGK